VEDFLPGEVEVPLAGAHPLEDLVVVDGHPDLSCHV
jgi:hypothetical protein